MKKPHQEVRPVLDEDDVPEITDEMFAAGVTYNPPLRRPRGKLVITGKKDGIVYAEMVRGGARPGAGRKTTGHVAVRLNIRPETRQKLRALSKKTGKPMSAIVDEAIAAA